MPALLVANGTNFPDALAGGAAAAQLGIPLLLTDPVSLPGATRNEIIRLRPFHIYVLGGGGSVSPAVASQLATLDETPGGPTRLIHPQHPNRYGTAAAVSIEFFGPGVATAFIATGLNSSMPWPVHRHRRYSAVRCYSSSRTRFPRRRHKS